MEDLLVPNTACTPVQPSLPIVAISMVLPSEYTNITETTPLQEEDMIERTVSLRQDLLAGRVQDAA